MTASTSSTLRPTTAGTLVAGFPLGRFYASPGTRRAVILQSIVDHLAR